MSEPKEQWLQALHLTSPSWQDGKLGTLNKSKRHTLSLPKTHVAFDALLMHYGNHEWRMVNTSTRVTATYNGSKVTTLVVTYASFTLPVSLLNFRLSLLR